KHGHALRRGPCIVVRMAKLKIIRSKHQNDERQRRIDFDTLCKPMQSVSSRLKRILPHRPPAIQAIFNHPHSQSGSVQLAFQNARPALLESKSVSALRNNSPSQRIAINKNLMHGLLSRLTKECESLRKPQTYHGS